MGHSEPPETYDFPDRGDLLAVASSRRPRRRWRTTVRTVLVSAAVVALLAWGTVRVARHPRQLEGRAERWLEAAAGGTVRAGPAGTLSGGGWSLGEAELRTAPGERPWLRIEDVRVDGPGAGAALPVGRVLRRLVGAQTRSPRRSVTAARAVLRPGPGRPPQGDEEAGPNRDATGAAGSRHVASSRDLLGVLGAAVRRAEPRPVALEVGEVLVEGESGASTASGGAEGRSEDLPLPRLVRDVRAVVDAGGRFLGEAELAPGPEWDHGRLELFLDPNEGRLHVHVEVENFDGGASWLARLPGAPQAAGALRRDGRWNVTLALRRERRGAGLEWWAETRHFDSELELPGPAGVAVRHFRGWLRLRPGLARFDPPGRGVVWGTDVEVAGSLGAEGEGLEVAFLPTDAARVPASHCPGPLATLLAFLRPQGRISGSLRPGGDGWEAELEGAGLSPAGLSGVRVGSVRLEVSGRGGRGQGTLSLDRLRWRDHAGSVTGELAVAWDESTLSFRGEGLEVGRADGADIGGSAPEGGGPESHGAPERSEGRTGTVDVRWELDRGSDAIRGQGSWSGAVLRTPLIRAERFGGEFRRTTEPHAEAPARARGSGIDPRGGFLEGSVRCDDVVLPGAGPGGELLRFESGEGRWKVEGGAFVVHPLHFRAADRVLRVHGRVRFDGEVDLLCLLVEGERAADLEALALDAPPARWLEVTGHRDGRTWRLTGPLARPVAEPVDAYGFVYRFAEEG